MLRTSTSSDLRRRQERSRNYFSRSLINIFYIGWFVLIIYGFIELYKTKHFIFGQCQVKSIEVLNDGDLLYASWNITLIYENQRTDEVLISSNGQDSKSLALKEARKYKINETYPCYHSRNRTSIIQWGWQWNKPTKLKAYGCIFGSTIFLFIGTSLRIFLKYCRKEYRYTLPQQPETNEEQQQTTASRETPPPPYDEAVKSLQ